MEQIVPVEDDDGGQEEYSRLKCDPAISTADLERALEQYFAGIGYRSVQEVLDIISEAKCTWKTAPKARAYYHTCL